jgi:type IV pilus assembly protein PilN
MIEINLLPGSGKKSRGRRSGAGIGAAVSSAAATVKDPYLVGMVGAIAVAALVVGGLFFHERALAADLADRETKAVQDSTRYAAVLGEKRRAIAQRDSVVRQLNIIKSIDNNRFVWPHVMDEVSAALPSYTWLTSVVQTSAPPAIAGSDTSKAPKGKAAAADSSDAAQENMRFHVVGNTVDIQALTHFMKQLEASAFIQHVTLVKSNLAAVNGREVTQFELDCEYQSPDSSAIRTVPVALSVR